MQSLITRLIGVYLLFFTSLYERQGFPVLFRRPELYLRFHRIDISGAVRHTAKVSLARLDQEMERGNES
jgi:hypothetical protein